MSDTHTRTGQARNRPSIDAIEIETMHDVFSDWERRAILYCLQERDSRVPVKTVAADLVGWWRGHERPVSTDDDVVTQVRDRLGYAHLLELHEFGVVSYDPRRETVCLADDMKVSVSEPWSDRPAEAEAGQRLSLDATDQ